MVPMDQPAAALDMIDKFMFNKDLAAEDEDVKVEMQAGEQRKQAVV